MSGEAGNARPAQEYVAACQALLDLAQDKQRAIVAGNMERLQAIVAAEEELLSTLSSRGAELTAGLPESLKEEARRILAQLRSISEENLLLLRQALRYVHWMQNLLVSGEATTYDADGTVPASATIRHVIDKQA